ncbi:hypothetical protein ACFQT0_03605 [Hymenobacter humi]|uniref:Secreted protein n=1 Tax=Hymenobacter humi TaxID=1411620 RepID=A0ABW2TZH2_9BACT
MPALRSHIALLLLLCLVRTLLPESVILTLHSHAHTTAEPAQAPAFVQKGKALVGPQHQHCDVEHFYNVAFQPALPVPVPGPRVAPRYAAPAAPLAARAAVGLPTWAPDLRGPPRRA